MMISMSNSDELHHERGPNQSRILAWRTEIAWLVQLLYTVALVVLSFVKGWTWTTSNLGTLLTAEFGMIGIIGSVLTGFILRDIRRSEGKLTSDISRIKKIEERLAYDITELEDATRRNLEGFGDIFARAYWLLGQSQDRLIYVNFCVRFGMPHVDAQVVKSDYAVTAKMLGLDTTDFGTAVNRFYTLMDQKMRTIPKAELLLLDPVALHDRFLQPLKRKKEYQNLNIKEVLATESIAQMGIANARGGRKSQFHQGDFLKTSDLAVFQSNSIPIQLLITRIPGRDGGGKWGTLVFLLGTENVHGDIPRGFYSELDHIEKVYSNFAQGLMEAQKMIVEDDCFKAQWEQLLKKLEPILEP